MPIILVTLKAAIRRIAVPGKPGQNVSETPISTNSWAWWCMTVSPAMAGGIK
jgi:hypothetical protein